MRVLVAVVAAVVCGVIVVRLAGGGQLANPPGGKGPPAARPPSAEDPADGLGRELASLARAGSREDHPAVRQGDRVAVRAAAKRFLSAYLPYEVGSGPVSEVEEVSTAGFARRLSARPPRLPPGLETTPVQAEVVSLAVVEGDGDLTVVARLARSGMPEAAVLRLARSGNRWVVSGVGG